MNSPAYTDSPASTGSPAVIDPVIESLPGTSVMLNNFVPNLDNYHYF